MRWWFLVTALLLSGSRAVEYVDYFANNGFSNVGWGAALYDENFNQTIVAYQGLHEDPFVVAYNHDTTRWRGPYRAGINTMGLTPDPSGYDPSYQPDNHGKPAMVIDDLGFIHMSFGGHGGFPTLSNAYGPNCCGDTFRGKQIHVRTKHPGDVSSWIVMNSGLDVYGTYPRFFNMGSSVLYHFIRHGAHRSAWTYQISTNHGNTWGPAQRFLQTKPSSAVPGYYDAWYCNFAKGKDAYSHLILSNCVYHLHLGSDDNYSSNGYFMYLNTQNNRWYNIYGVDLTGRGMMPLSKENADRFTLAVDTSTVPGVPSKVSGRPVHPGACVLDSNGHPHLLYRISSTQYTGRRIHYVRWTGSAWTDPVRLTDPPLEELTGGNLRVLPDRIEILATVRGQYVTKIVEWTSYDQGVTWSMETVLSSDWNRGLIDSQGVGGGRSDAKFVAHQVRYLYNPDGTVIAQGPYRHMFLVGMDGTIIPRLKQEANICTGILLSQREAECRPVEYPCIDSRDCDSSYCWKGFCNPAWVRIMVSAMATTVRKINYGQSNPTGGIVVKRDSKITEIKVRLAQTIRVGRVTFKIAVNGVAHSENLTLRAGQRGGRKVFRLPVAVKEGDLVKIRVIETTNLLPRNAATIDFGLVP